MGNKHKIINDASCLKVVVYGKNMKELFENAAFTLCSLIAKPDADSIRKPMKITATANNTEDLLMNFLKELLHYYSVRKILLCSFRVMSLTENKVHAKLTGENIGRHHSIINDIKSARYEDIKISKTRTGYKTHIVFDVPAI
ncbi:MAG: archease [Elusimicrobia bacterium]|nr:archease [Elusimicrobiota bacterium]